MARAYLIARFCVFTLVVFFGVATAQAFAQLAPSGDHYAGRPTDTGYGGNAVDAAGNLPAAIPLEFPEARGGLPIPLQITYGGHGVGAAGLGWEVPLSYLQQDSTLAHRRPASGPSVLPVPRERTILSLLGQSVDLIGDGSGWFARTGTLELRVRQVGKLWFAYDGQGRTYTFERPAALASTSVWLLKSIRAGGGAELTLSYQITTWPIDGGTGTGIDLVHIAYNTHAMPAQPAAVCAKNDISLSYLNGAITPISLSVLDDTILVRKNTLTQIDVTSRVDCSTEPQRLRRYAFAYGPDADTGLPRLNAVTMFGRQGTPEENTSLPVAAYSYGSATLNGSLHYRKTQTISLPAGFAAEHDISATASDSSANVPESGERYAMWQTLTDFDGDGRPDLVFKNNNKLWIAKGHAAAGGATTFGAGAQAPVPLSDTTFTSGGLSTQSMTTRRFAYGPANRNTTDIWRQAIDVNGDGRIDIVDAAEEPDHWVVYLNTPGPSGVTWQRRSFSIQNLRLALVSRGHKIAGNYLPLSRRATGTNIEVWQCWQWDGSHWNWWPEGFNNHRCQGVGNTIIGRGPELTYVEWELADLNGDGYPDFVFDSTPVDFQVVPPSSTPKPVQGASRDGQVWQNFAPQNANAVRAAFNVLGVRFDTNANAFAQSVDLSVQFPNSGVSEWVCPGSNPNGPCDQTTQRQFFGFADVNGDGLLDRIVGTKAYLGEYAGTAHEFSSAYLTLPGPLATQYSTHDLKCVVGGPQNFTAEQTQGLRDLTGDGIPDYYDNGRVWIGTGTGFQQSVAIDTAGANFQFSHETETCDGKSSNTDGGLYDIDGDGKPDVVGVVGQTFVVSQLVGSGVPGAPESGRLTQIDNGYGASTTIGYVSAKQFVDNALPFPEIVVASITTIGTHGLGGDLNGFRYAYGQGVLVFNSVLDRFVFPGYDRRVALQILGSAPTSRAPGKRGSGAATITDSWPLMPFTLGLTKQQRWFRTQLVGRLRDVFTLRATNNTDPWSLLGVQSNDTLITGETLFDWDAKLYETPQTQPENLIDCFDIVAPLDFDQTLASLSDDALNVCRAHGFAFQTASTSWHGDAAPPSDKNIQTRSQVLAVDDFGRPTKVEYQNDLFRSDDDICVENAFAAPILQYPRVLNALSARRVYAATCEKGNALASESWLYDNLPAGSVSKGRLSSHSVDRRSTDTGTLLETIHLFDATYDADGNIAAVRTQRGSASRTVTFAYDTFGIVPIRASVAATNVPSTNANIAYDPLSLLPLSSTDDSQTVRAADYDGFGRPVRSTLTLAGGSLGVVSTSSYAGFDGNDAGGRRVTMTRFQDAVPPANVAAAAGRTATIFLDELGRTRHSEISLGADYSNETLVLDSPVYDGSGRVIFTADPFPKTQNAATAYGSSYFYTDTGDVDCIISGFGPIARNATTDAAAERFPMCFSRTFAGHVDTLDVTDSSSLQVGSPQFGVAERAVRTAIGRTIERSTLRAGIKLGKTAFAYDLLGNVTSMTRYLNPANATGAVGWSVQHDSLGRIVRFSAPAVATRTYRYSAWGEPVETDWVDGATPRSLVSVYDSLSRVTRTEERNGGIADPATLDMYAYDVASTTAPLTPTFVLGRLARAKSAKGSVSFSYDALGHVNATAFTDDQGAVYSEKTAYHVDGTLASLTFSLPDDGFHPELVTYGYDSADRLRTVKYGDATSQRDLYQATNIDLFGRVRTARYGGATDYRADYADGGRQLIQQVAIRSPFGSRRFVFDRFDALERELARHEFSDDATSGSGTTLSYDALGHLATATQSSGTAAPSTSTFRYDALGNLLTLKDVPGTAGATLRYQTVDRDRLCRIDYGSGVFGIPGPGHPRPPCNVTHDASGSITSERTRTGSRQLSYFSSGNVRTITQQGNQANFDYDPFGQLQALNVQNSSGQVVRTERHIGGLLEQHDAMSPSGTVSFVTRNIPGPGGIVASRRGPGSDWVYEFGELRGNRVFTSENGAFVQGIDYQPFGEAKSTGAMPGTTSYTSSQWNSGDALAEFGLSHLGARVYDPVIGRFLSRDPLSHSGSASSSNPYAFAADDPWNASDPSGFDCTGIGQECPDSPLLSGIGSAVASIATSLFGGSGAASVAVAPPVTSGPTAAGRQLYAEIYDELGYVPENFNVDTLAATGISLSDALDHIKQTPSAERNADIDAYNAHVETYASFSAGFGESIWFWCPGCGQGLRQQTFGISSGNGNSFAHGAGSVTGMVAAFLLSRVPPIRVPSVGAPAPGPVPPPARALSAAEAEVVESIRDVNPTNGTTNCINCAIATEYTIRGSPSSAVPSYPKLNLLDVEERFGTLRPVSGPAEIEDALLRSGPGSTGIISGESAIPGQIGHVFNVANPDGTALFLDGQVGRLGDYNFFTLRDLKFILIRAGVSY